MLETGTGQQVAQLHDRYMIMMMMMMTYKGHCLDGIDSVVSSEKYEKSIVNVWDLT
jgi:sulfopyruvate decarboxylase TPP-binding subunit